MDIQTLLIQNINNARPHWELRNFN